MAGISVRVKTVKVIAAIEAKIAEIETAEQKYKAVQVKEKEAVEKHKEKLLEAVSGGTVISVDNNARWGSGSITEVAVTYKLKKATPRYEQSKEYTDAHTAWRNTNNTQLEELKNSLRILQMTDQEDVNATTFNKISKFL